MAPSLKRNLLLFENFLKLTSAALVLSSIVMAGPFLNIILVLSMFSLVPAFLILTSMFVRPVIDAIIDNKLDNDSGCVCNKGVYNYKVDDWVDSLCKNLYMGISKDDADYGRKWLTLVELFSYLALVVQFIWLSLVCRGWWYLLVLGYVGFVYWVMDSSLNLQRIACKRLKRMNRKVKITIVIETELRRLRLLGDGFIFEFAKDCIQTFN